jgi:O-antigen/teichoic acid export membrane protein
LTLRFSRLGGEHSTLNEFSAIMSAVSQFGALGRWLIGSRHGVAAIAQTIATRFLLAGMNVGTGIITARSLGAAGRGELAAMTLWPMLVPSLLALGLPAAVRFCIRREPTRDKEFYSLAILAAAGLSILAFGVGVFAIPTWLHQYSSAVVRDAQICMIFAAQVMLNLIIAAMLEAIGDFKLANSVRLLSTLMTFFTLGALVLFHVMSPFLAALAYLAPPALAGLWAAWKLGGYFSLPAADPRPALRVLGSYSVRSYGIDILATLSLQLDQLLVVGFLSATAMGMYMVALNASRVLQILYTAVVTVVFPSASGLETGRIVAMVARAARVSTLIAVVFAAMLAALLPVLIPLFYGRSFTGSVHVGQLLMLEGVIGGLTYVLSQAFMASDAPGQVTVFQAVGFGTALPCMLVLMPRFGIMGAAIALLVATSVRLAFVLASFPLVLHVPVPNLMPRTEDFAIFRRVLAGRA